MMNYKKVQLFSIGMGNTRITTLGLYSLLLLLTSTINVMAQTSEKNYVIIFQNREVHVTYLKYERFQEIKKAHYWKRVDTEKYSYYYVNEKGQVLYDKFPNKCGIVFNSSEDYLSLIGKVALFQSSDTNELLWMILLGKKEIKDIFEKEKVKLLRNKSKDKYSKLYLVNDKLILYVANDMTWGELYQNVYSYDEILKEMGTPDFFIIVPKFSK